MWLFTTIGFFSVVQKPKDTKLTIRARVRSDLDRLRERYMPAMSETFADLGTDYRYRSFIGHVEFAQGLARLGKDIRYPNFKGEVSRKQGTRRAKTYSNVWAALWDLQREDDEEERKRARSRSDPSD